ncbi:hypothetical protein GCM10009416_02230 [Craurococcus roseus]|uniref:Uncharacterized protein n=1 Tax=Craurococcus roseus TaxID=77585 RepID=A0ABP3PHM8_9PROT
MRQRAVPARYMEEGGRQAEAPRRGLHRHHAVGALDNPAGLQGTGAGDPVLHVQRGDRAHGRACGRRWNAFAGLGILAPFGRGWVDSRGVPERFTR